MTVSYAPNREIAVLCHVKEEGLHKPPFAFFCRNKEYYNQLHSASTLHQTANLSKPSPTSIFPVAGKQETHLFPNIISLFAMASPGLGSAICLVSSYIPL